MEYPKQITPLKPKYPVDRTEAIPKHLTRVEPFFCRCETFHFSPKQKIGTFFRRLLRGTGGFLLVFIFISWSVNAGVALRLYYRDIPGDAVTDLTNHSSFPNHPTSAEPLTESLETAT